MKGFLPEKDPLDKLPKAFSAWENIAHALPKLLVGNCLRQTIRQLPPFPIEHLKNARQIERAMMILSYLGHAYVWGDKHVPDKLPSIIAQPWYEVSQKLGRPPVLSYASYALHNWKRLDITKPIELGNIVLLQNFLGGVDEEWFILVHVDIEAKAISAMNACAEIIKSHDLNLLSTIVTSLENMCAVLDRMVEHCDPYIYYHRVRPYIHGWKNHPSLPNGLIYEGVGAYHNQPQQFRGETGAQSGIIPCLDALLGVTHENDELKAYLMEMRLYMPPKHRAFLEKIEKKSRVREKAKKSNNPDIKNNYNACIKLIERFRTTHLRYAASYIQHQAQLSPENPNAVGTGGTPFMRYLKKHRDETDAFLIK